MAAGEEAIRVAAAELPARDAGLPERDRFEEQRGRLRRAADSVTRT